MQQGQQGALAQVGVVRTGHQQRAVHRADGLQEDPGPSGAEVDVGRTELVEERHDVVRQRLAVVRLDGGGRTRSRSNELRHGRTLVLLGGPAAGRDRSTTEDQPHPVLPAQLLPAGHRHDEPEAVGQRGVELLSSQVGVAVDLARRVDRRPPVAQAGEFLTGQAPLVDQREQLVLQVGPTAVDLVEEDELGVPHGTGSAQVLKADAVVGRDRDADQVVVVEE